MKSIAFIVPYFGKLPNLFPLWLLTCAKNPTVDWFIFTDDKTPYNYPPNVKVRYCTFDDIRQKIQLCYDFKISLDRPYKLCDYRVAYGEIFNEEIRSYDFWGYCDLDLLWGNIRKFYTDDVLERFDKIGFQGHSSIYRNTKDNTLFYRTYVEGCPNFKEIFTNPKNYIFDESIICNMYDLTDRTYFKETVFAHLNRYSYGFFLKYLPKEEEYKNRRQIFTWKNGNLTRLYLDRGEIRTEDYMYIHFFSRPMKIVLKKGEPESRYIIVPDKIIEDNISDIDVKYIEKHGKKSAMSYYIRCLIQHRKKITPIKLITAFLNQIKNHK